MVDKVVDKVIITNEELQIGIKKAADWINKNYKGKKVLFLGILKGCIPFFGSIIPMIELDCEIDFMSASSFCGETEATDKLLLKFDSTTDVEGKDIIILEDIIDTARTLNAVVNELKKRKAKSISIVTLIDKKVKRMVDLNADYACFEIPDLFIVGFGFDYKEEMRNIPHICTVKDRK